MKFECKKCGHCCINMGEKNYLPLWEWEVDRLKELAEKKGISINIRPVDMMLDKRTNLSVSMQYQIRAPCPFLINNECSIYKERPLICKSFPMVNDVYFSGNTIDLDIGDCNAFTSEEYKFAIKGTIEDGKFEIPKGELKKRYINFFGEEIFYYSVLMHQIKAYALTILKHMIENKMIKFRKISKFDYDKYNSVPIFEFAKRLNLFNQEAKNEIIKDLNDYDKIKRLIEDTNKGENKQ